MSKNPIIRKNKVFSHIVKRKGKPLTFIDLGVPRNIESGVADIENTYLYNIDDLKNVILDNMDKRKKEVKNAEGIIRKEVDEFRAWLSERDVIPMIRNLRVSCEKVRMEELEKIKNRISSETFETLDLVTRRIVKKLLHNPIIAMRASKSGAPRERLLKSVNKLFIKDSNE